MEVETVSVLLAFVAGIVSFVSPCHLAILPAYLGIVGNGEAGRAVALRRGALFMGGFAAVMVALGMSVGLVGYLVWDEMPIIRKVAGVALLFFALHVAGVLRIGVLYRDLRWQGSTDRLPRGFAPFAAGAVFGFGWSPCVGPVLAAILFLAAETATVWEGGVLLAAYAAGLAIPFLSVALFVDRAAVLRRLRGVGRGVELATGAALFAMGVLVYTNQLQRVSGFLGTVSPL